MLYRHLVHDIATDFRSHAAKRKKVTIREHFAYRMQSRPNEAQTILRSRRLFQQFVVDGYAMIESQRLNYVRDHQQYLRVDKYKNLSHSTVANYNVLHF